MYYDSINLVEGASISNLVVAKGTTFPSNANVGEMFYRTDTSTLHTYDGSSWIAMGTGAGGGGGESSTPKMTAIYVTDDNYAVLDDTAVDLDGGYIKIIGQNFAEGCSILIGNTPATSTTFISSTEIRAQVQAFPAGSYVVYVVNTDGGTAIRVNGITYSAFPVWSTDSALNAELESAVSIQLSAGEANTFALQAGSSLPPGLSLSAGGLISGTISGADPSTTYTFTVVATDPQNQDTPRTFNVTLTAGGDEYWDRTTLLINADGAPPFTKDLSENNFQLTLNGDVKPSRFSPLVEGHYSNYFDGTGDYLSCAASTAFDITSGNFTVECWVYRTVNGVEQYLFSCRQDNPARGWEIRINSTNFVQFFFTGGSSIISSSAIPTNTWTHLAVTRSSNTTRLFINGAENVSATFANGTTATSSIYIGYGTTGGGLLTGYISNARIVKGTALYTSNFTPSTTPLTAVSGTSLLTCQSNRFVDNSANNFTITRNGDVAIRSASPFALPEGFSEYGSAYFDGTGDYLTVPSNAAFAFGTGDYTIECWVYPTSASNMRICEFSDNTDNFEFNASNSVLNYYNGSSSSTSASSSAAVNSWSHITIVRSSGTVRGYINGTQVLTQATTPNTASARSLHIGGITNILFNGYISNLRVVKGTALYTSNFTPSTTPLTAVSGTSLLTCQSNNPANNSSFIDRSSLNNVVNRVGNVSQGTFSPYGDSWSNYFDGSGDYISIPTTSATMHQIGDWTYEGWIYWNSMPTTGYQNIFGQGAAGQNSFGLYAANPSSNTWSAPYRFKVNQANIGDRITGTTTIVAGQWYHFALVRSSGTVTLYVDGTAEGTYANSTDYTFANNAFFIGNNSNCYISNFRFVRSAVYTENFTPSASPLQVIDKTSLLTCQSNALQDVSPNRHVITRVGDTRVDRFAPFGNIVETSPKYSMFFDGTGDHALVSQPATTFITATGDWTIEAWINARSFAGPQYSCAIFNVGGISADNLLLRAMPSATTTTTLNLYAINAAGAAIWSAGTGGGTVSLNTWHHVAAVREAGIFKVYLDGNLVITDSSKTTEQIRTSTAGIAIGGAQAGTSARWNGLISNVRVINGTALYTENFTPSASPLTAVSGTALLTCQSSTPRDNSSNNFTVTLVNDARPVVGSPFGRTFSSKQNYSPEVFGGSMFFDGSGDYLQGTAQLPITTGPFTIECWIYPRSLSNASLVLSKFWRTGQNGGYQLSMLNTGLIVLYASSGTYNTFPAVITSTLAVNINQWTHIAVTRNFSNQIMIYINGQAAATPVTYATSLDLKTASDQQVFRIGGEIADGTLYNPFNGYITDVKVLPVTALYTSAFVPPSAPLLPSANTTLLLNGNNAAIKDATMLTDIETVGNTRIETSVVKNGSGSIFFDGNGDALKIPHSDDISLGSGDFTLECWAYFNNVNTRMVLINKGWNTSGAGYASYLIWMENNGTLRFLASSNGGSWDIANERVIGTMTAGTWKHIAITRSGTTFRAFIDGQINSSFTFTSSLALVTNVNQLLYIGGRVNDSMSMNGYLDDIRITRGFARYTTNFTPPTSFKTK